MKRIYTLFTLAFVLFMGAGRSLQACNYSYLRFDSLRVVDTVGTPDTYTTYFRACIGGGATNDSLGLPFADGSTINLLFVVWPSSVTIPHTFSNAYPASISTPMPTTCTNCTRLSSYKNSGRRGFADPPQGTGSGGACPQPTFTSCPTATPTYDACGGIIWYTANDQTNRCYGGAFCGGTNSCTGSCCSTMYTGGNRRPAFVDTTPGTTGGWFCFQMYIRTLGKPDSLEMQDVENSNHATNNYCRTFGGATRDEVIRLSSMTFPIQWLFVNAEARMDDKLNHITWGTAIEENTDRFMVMKSQDGIEYFPIGSVKANSTFKGQFNYSFDDLNPVTGTNFYKIVEVTKDLNMNESEVVTVNYSGWVKSHINYVSPVPTIDKATVSFYASEAKQFSVMVFDIKGSVILKTEIQASVGENKYEIDLSDKENGVYFVNFISGSDKFGGKLVKSN